MPGLKTSRIPTITPDQIGKLAPFPVGDLPSPQLAVNKGMRLNLKKWRTLRRDPWRKIFYDAFAEWKRDKGEDLRFRFPNLTAESVIFDMGGFEGNWAARLHSAHGGTYHIFEPHPRFSKEISQRFNGMDNMHCHPFALGSKDGTLDLSDTGDASSAVAANEKSVSGSIRAVSGFFAENTIPKIDLMKINIEGGEYDLLPALIDSETIGRIALVQIQFHLYQQSDIALREEIRARLSQTHTCDWVYPFVWEQWSLKT